MRHSYAEGWSQPAKSIARVAQSGLYMKSFKDVNNASCTIWCIYADDRDSSVDIGKRHITPVVMLVQPPKLTHHALLHDLLVISQLSQML